MGHLSGQGIQQLSTQLAGAMNLDDLSSFVHASTGDRLFVEYVASGKPLRPTITDLLNQLEERGTTGLFLAYVWSQRPGRPDLRQAIQALYPDALNLNSGRILGLSAQSGGTPQPASPTNGLAPGLERNVRPHLAKLDVRVWMGRLSELERRVCRIELNGNALGTGFLVGSEVVLTNWHVVEESIRMGKIGDIGCRFDYVQLADGSRQVGQLVRVRADGCISSSPYAPSEITETPGTPPPTAKELDFALLYLTEPAGQQLTSKGIRGWITLPEHQMPASENSPLLILQHPEGQPMKLALDTQAIIGMDESNTRIRYRTNTDPGSSGSPCFSMDWEILALHHFGDPNWKRPVYNQGVAVHLVRKAIMSGPGASLLGT